MLGDLIILSTYYSEKTISLMDDILEIEKINNVPINLKIAENNE